jgi:putative ABC transport system permease protein
MIRFLPLVWAMLWRRKARTALTFGSIAVAFMLFGMLHAFGSLFSSGAELFAADNLFVGHRYGLVTKPLPYAYRGQIEAVEGVKAVIPVDIFFMMVGDHQDGGMVSLAVDPDHGFDDRRLVVSPEHLRAIRETRTGMIAGRDLATKLGWKVGDHVPVKSPAIKRRDGADHWEFDVVGLFDYNAEVMGEGVSSLRAFVRYDYVDEARIDPGNVDLFITIIDDPAQAPTVIKAIDERFQNSAHPTRTQTEAEQQRATLEQVGDIGLIITAVLSAVFFTLTVVAGNTMMRAFRERIPELGVMKTLGFTDRAVAGLVAVESLLLCIGAGLAGLGLAWLVLKPLAKAIAAVLPILRMEPATLGLGAALAVALGIAAAAVPVWRSARLTIVDALAGR